MTPEEVIRALADPERLSVAGALALGPRSAQELADDLGLPLDRVRHHLRRLVAARLAIAQPDRRSYRLDDEGLRGLAREIGPSRDPGLALGAVDEEEEAVLRHYFADGRLREVPSKRSKRLVVLARLSLEFDVGVRYSERQVNDALRRFHTDHVALRRHLVDEGFLSRERGEYWRTGGPVDL